MASMKLVMEDGKELAVDDLQPIVIGEHKKVIITIETGFIENMCLDLIVQTFDKFFGYGNWMLSASKMQIDLMEEENEQQHI